LGAWQVAGSQRSPYFPPPSTWASALADLWSGGDLLPAAGATMGTFFAAIATATVVGAGLGLLLGTAPRLEQALRPVLEFARAIPPAAVAPVAVLLIGYNTSMKIAVVTIAAIWPILLNTSVWVRRLDPIMLDTARSLHLGRFERARKVIFPASIAGIILGVRLAAPIALVVTLVVEFLTHVDGIGALIATAQQDYQPAQVWGLILVAGLFSVLVNGLIAALEAYTLRYRPRQ
jgi:ABC-type nitrate/sulfonate/bicarbonate transport system permease component